MLFCWLKQQHTQADHDRSRSPYGRLAAADEFLEDGANGLLHIERREPRIDKLLDEK